MELTGEMLLPGEASGPLLRLTAPISFWGGVDPQTGTIADPRHPQAGARLAGRVLVVGRTRGSSSSSAVMLELIHAGLAPAALVLGEVDAILVLGCLVAREMGWPPPPVLRLDAAALAAMPDAGPARLAGGRLLLG
ncbi:MAG: hypothetical protein OHK0024_13960 [Thalassobaculales bacterium]